MFKSSKSKSVEEVEEHNEDKLAKKEYNRQLEVFFLLFIHLSIAVLFLYISQW